MESDAFPRINRVIVTGFIQQQPELRHTPSGVPVSSFRVRTGRLLRDRRGAVRETFSTFTVVVWQDLALRVCQEAELGQGVTVEGSLHSRSFVAGNGERRTVLEVYADNLDTSPISLSPPELRGGGGGRDAESRPDERIGRVEEPPPPGEPHGEHRAGSSSEPDSGHHIEPHGDTPDRIEGPGISEV
jgi:single-strand DNA-binding protein